MNQTHETTAVLPFTFSLRRNVNKVLLQLDGGSSKLIHLLPIPLLLPRQLPTQSFICDIWVWVN